MRIYSVTEFNKEVNTLLSDITICMEGEVGNFKISQNRFVWFDLKDEKSYVSCFLMAFNLRVQLEDGMKVQLIGNPGLFTKSGRFHFSVKEIKLVGEGTLKKEYELLKKKLEAEGLFSMERKRQLPRFPERIGVITSSDAAAYTDVMKILKNRWAGLEIYFYPVSVQGQSAIKDIISAFNHFNSHDYKLDAIILTRGGGSMEDLWAFNTEEACRAVFGSKVPVVSAVGHERDITLVDFVADVRASTPSNAAELIAPHKDDVIFQIDNLINIQQKSFGVFQEKVDHALSLLQSYNPRNVLKRGYSITKCNGKILKDVKNIKKNHEIETILFNGKIKSKII